MKFAKDLEQELVPEWRAKYLDYKAGKKKLKAVRRALRSVNATPRTPKRNGYAPVLNESPESTSSTRRTLPRSNLAYEQDPSGETRFAGKGVDNEDELHRAQSQPIQVPETEPLTRPGPRGRSGYVGKASYGSIVATPPRGDEEPTPPALDLPDPALDPADSLSLRHSRTWNEPNHSILRSHRVVREGDLQRLPTSAYEIGPTTTPSHANFGTSPKNAAKLFGLKRMPSIPGQHPSRPFVQRMLSTGGPFSRALGDSPKDTDVPMEAYKDFDLRQAEFFNFLDGQLDKIEAFYKQKEDEATERLSILRAQLHEMRDRRIEEVRARMGSKQKPDEAGSQSNGEGSSDAEADGKASNGRLTWLKPLEGALNGAKQVRFGKNTEALTLMGASGKDTDARHNLQVDSNRDFIRRNMPNDYVPYRSAKRKLKLALAEYYRGLELLKSYALLNRTAFRKITKKYDKTVNARPTGRYMSEKVNKAWFVQSEVLDGHLQTIEDLYARYFERGNHKVSVGKLRTKSARAGDHTGSAFRNGLMVAAGLVFGIEGITYGAEKLYDPDPILTTNTSYLFQIYGGYFLALLLFILFALDCAVWTRNKINYVFIFELDSRHHLDWRELLELPCLFFFLLGLFLWLNFHDFGSHVMYLYYPVILIGLSVVILFFPAKLLYYRGRKWFLYSNWRLLLAGLYPVEFRDFFLGDVFCSLTYSMGNLELFFCLYARSWNGPQYCNSSHSRLLGFFSTLPGIWRSFQCLRRYYDTRNIFPHLVNCGKYMFTILYYMTLSIYRIDKNTQTRAVFITFALLNAIYCSIWDLVMDWSLCNPYAKHPFLRDTLGYKSVWWYYVAMVLDPILRFNWIFYAIFTSEVQHSAFLSFFVALSEALRRGMWTLFRVENEHCTNVGRFRASRDIPLPYDIPTPSTSSLEGERLPEPPAAGEPSPDKKRPTSARKRSFLPVEPALVSTSATGADIEAQGPPTPGLAPPTPSGLLRLRKTRTPSSPAIAPGSPRNLRGLARVGTLLSEAHAQDFERKRRPEVTEDDDKGDLRDPENIHNIPSSDEEDEDGYDDPSIDDVKDSRELEAARRLLRGTGRRPNRGLDGDEGRGRDRGDQGEHDDANEGHEHHNLHYE